MSTVFDLVGKENIKKSNTERNNDKKISGTVFDLIESKDFTPMESDAEEFPMLKEKNAFGKFEESVLSPIESTIRDYARSAVRGVAKGGVGFFDTLKELIAPENVRETLPSKGQLGQLINQTLPVEDSYGANLLENILQKTASSGPLLLAPGAIPATLAASTGEQLAEEAGLGPIGQFASGVVAGALPSMAKSALQGSAKKMITLPDKSKISQKDLQDLMSSYGLSEEEITPLIQSSGKEKLFKKGASTTSIYQDALERSHAGIDNLYESLRNVHPDISNKLSERSRNKILNNYFEIRKRLTTESLKDADEAIKLFLNSEFTGDDLMQFNKNLNAVMKKNPQQNAELFLLKDPVITEGLNELSPSLGKDFKNINKFKSRAYVVSSKINPGAIEKAITGLNEHGISRAMVDVIATNDLRPVVKMGGIAIGVDQIRKMMAKMLTNPKYTNLSEKFVSAINKNAPLAAKSIMEKYVEEMRKDKIDPFIINSLLVDYGED